jgi:flavin reductase (DIM6/NTAB) family NADH-FMN oxidoreductase RutF
MDKKAFYTIGYGIYIVASGDGKKYGGQIANTVFQVTSEPATVAVSINKQNHTHALILAGGKFAVSVLADTAPMTLIGRFGFKSGRDIDKFEGAQCMIGITGIPIVTEHAVASFEAEVIGSLDCGSHTIFLGRVIAAEVLGDLEPMTYAYYQKVKGGKAPKNAPTYQAPES